MNASFSPVDSVLELSNCFRLPDHVLPNGFVLHAHVHRLKKTRDFGFDLFGHGLDALAGVDHQKALWFSGG